MELSNKNGAIDANLTTLSANPKVWQVSSQFLLNNDPNGDIRNVFKLNGEKLEFSQIV